MDLKERMETVKGLQLSYEVQGYLSTNDADFLIETFEQMEKELNRRESFIDNLHVVHFTELQREKATVERYEKALKSIYEIIGYEENDEKIVDSIIETVEKALKG